MLVAVATAYAVAAVVLPRFDGTNSAASWGESSVDLPSLLPLA
jgi:hypothetical protein